jgi:VanZ family protein
MTVRFWRGFLLYVLPAILYSIFIFLMSSLSAPPTPTFELEWGDKVTHAGAFGLMMLTTFRAVRWILGRKSLRLQVGIALLYCILYGATDEIHQYFVPNRSCDIFDLLADAVGAMLGALFIAVTIRYAFGRALFGSVPTGA